MSMMHGATNAKPTLPLIRNSEDRNSRKQFCFHLEGSRWAVLLVVLFVLQVIGILALGLYCAQTYTCAINVQHPQYNCENGIAWPGYKEAMIVELVFVIFEVLSWAIFLAFCFKSIRERRIRRGICGMIFDICKRLIKLPKMWILVALYVICVIRFAALLSDEPDLGSEKEIAKATIGMYIVDSLGITLVVAVLNDIKIQELANDNGCLCKIICYDCRDREGRPRVVWYVFKLVLFCFCAQFVSYLVVVTAQATYGVIEISETSKGETKNYKVISFLKTFGQIVFMKEISSSLWFKLFDDGYRTVGERTDEETNYGGNEAYHKYRGDLISSV